MSAAFPHNPPPVPMTEADIHSLDRRSFLNLGAAATVAGIAWETAPKLLAQDTPGTAADAAPASAALAAKAVAASEDAILRISREVWENAELSLAEVKSAQIHLRELKAAGFKIVSTGTSGVPTAFLAEWSQGSGGAKIGFLPEYDALPGLGNAPRPQQTASADGNTSGHGCGHNLLGAGCTGGAIALKRMLEESGAPGTIRVYGCAAEETEGAKVYMAREGLFNDLDAALAWHPAPVAAAGLVRTAAYSGAKIMFRGRTAHAGNSPWDGRSALKAAELFSHGVHLMQDHPTDGPSPPRLRAGRPRAERGAGLRANLDDDPRCRPPEGRSHDRLDARHRGRCGHGYPDESRVRPLLRSLRPAAQ